jgi:hypothetical protein
MRPDRGDSRGASAAANDRFEIAPYRDIDSSSSIGRSRVNAECTLRALRNLRNDNRAWIKPANNIGYHDNIDNIRDVIQAAK